MMKLFHFFVCAAALGLGGAAASAQTSSSGQASSFATPTPPPVGIASTALSGAAANGAGSMGSGVNVPVVGTTQPIVPGMVVINSNANTVGASSAVAGSVQINNGGAGSVTGISPPISPIPTYVVPGTGLGATVATSGTTGATTLIQNPNPGSVQ